MNKEPKYRKSENDKLFYDIFGYYPNKAGEAYEILSTAAYAIATSAAKASLNTRVRGNSGALHQLDGRLIIEEHDVLLEAKDYKSKIGLNKISEVKGRLSDLPVDCAVYAAQQYTSPARKFAKGTFDNGDKKGVVLLDIRKSVKEDVVGRIGTVTLKISCSPFPEMDKLNWSFVLSRMTIEMIAKDGIDIQLENGILIVDDNDKNVEIIPEFEKAIFNLINEKSLSDGDIISGYLQKHGLFAKLSNGKKYPIENFCYKVPICVISEEIKIAPNGKPVIYIKSDDGSINKLITDTDLIEWGRMNGIAKMP